MDLTREESRRRFTDAPVAVLATVGDGNIPHTVPVVYVTIRDPETGDHLYVAIDDKPKSAAGPSGLRRLRNIAAHPQVSLLAQHYDDDWSRLWWVRADGFAAVVEFGNCPKELLAALQAKYPYYAEHPPAGPVIDVDVIDWTGWSFTNS